MREEIIQVVILTAIIIKVISSIRGSKARDAQEEQPSRGLLDLLGEIMGRPEEMPQAEVPAPQAAPVHRKKRSKAERRQNAEQPKASASATPVLSARSNAPSAPSLEQADPEFDLRQAVIYSEILKPRFESYD